jgi:hypothetical protein
MPVETARKTVKLTEAQLCFETHMKELGLHCEREYKFHEDRKWLADYMIMRPIEIPHPGNMVLVEIEGGAFTRGRHTRGKGFIEDMLKYSTASALYYRIFRFTPSQVLRGEAKEFIKKWL